MKVPRDPRDYLEDIRCAVLKALEFVEGMTHEDFLVDDNNVDVVWTRSRKTYQACCP